MSATQPGGAPAGTGAAVSPTATSPGGVVVRLPAISGVGDMRRMTLPSTLVETVSIDYEDFNESFLTCGTCLCMYDGGEHTPKLLPCSHTVCLHCLTRIAASHSRDQGTFRCPICRELITIPRGGVAALPPSFLVNQLLDLMSRQRREVVPKCSVHIGQELLFCETCDTVFCSLCTGGRHNSGESTTSLNSGSGSSVASDHTIIPFSIAIKRICEILLYKANMVITRLNEAHEAVESEVQRLSLTVEACLETVGKQVTELSLSLERRKQELLEIVAAAGRDKKRILDEQLALISSEKEKVERECEGLRYELEVRSISQRIASLGEKLESAAILREPRENAFLICEFSHNGSLKEISDALSQLGRVRTSTTFPSLCTAVLEEPNPAIALLEARVRLWTVDYHGSPRTSGGDPVTADFKKEPLGDRTSDVNSDEVDATEVIDCEDGSYYIKFRPKSPGTFQLLLNVLQRPIKDHPLIVEVTEHNDPLFVYGSRGSGKDEFLQPVGVATDDDMVYVLDTGNSRIKVLNMRDLTFVKHIENPGLAGRSCTGIAVSENGLVVVNWRSKLILEMNFFGETVSSFSHPQLEEPIDVAVESSNGNVLVADNGACCVFAFDKSGKLLFQVGRKGTGADCFSSVSAVCFGPDGEIIVADSSIKVFNAKGEFQKELGAEAKGRGKYSGITVDSCSRILVSRTEKARNCLQVIDFVSGNLLSTIDSQHSKLKRPSGVAVTPNQHVIVVDLGNECVKMYRYW